jgi:REP element-mobilizing transposase RayT
MPRIGRVVAQNMPHHIVQRGHNKNAVFVEEIELRTGIRLEFKRPGRPAKEQKITN